MPTLGHAADRRAASWALISQPSSAMASATNATPAIVNTDPVSQGVQGRIARPMKASAPVPTDR